MTGKIKIMISSRVDDVVTFTDKEIKLSELRKQIKADIEKAELFGVQIFECWISEDAPPAAGSDDSWQVCLQQVHDADLVVVLYNGSAGWAKSGGSIGICHAELHEAMQSGAAKVRLIELPLAPDSKDESQCARDRNFRDYGKTLNLFRGASVEQQKDALDRALEAVRDATVALARDGVRGARRAKFDTGDALNWSLLNFATRKDKIEKVVTKALRAYGETEDGMLSLSVADTKVLVCVHGIPAATSVAPAREMVGRPFLQDYKLAHLLEKATGPVHIIGCNRNVTETQAMTMLGFPDATIVSSSFGVYVADPIQNIQLIFIANCRDETTTRQGVQLFMEWLDSSGEGSRFAGRATSRAKIVRATADELDR